MKELVHNVFVTGRCNLECPFCFSKRIRKDTEDNVAEVASEIVRVNAPVIRFCGGEPLLDMDRLEYLYGLVQPGTQVIINTNGLGLNQAIVDWVNRESIVVQVSLDGYDRGHRPLIDLDQDLLKQIRHLWVNQILFHPEDADKIERALLPNKHEVGLLYGQKVSQLDDILDVAEAARGRFLARIDPGSYHEITTHHTGQTFYVDTNAETDYCVQTRKRLGEYAWKLLRHRK